MKIRTTNEKGEKIIVDYSVTTVAEEAKPDIEINCYEQFRRCVQRINELHEYHGVAKEAQRYQRAISYLMQKDKAAYERYNNRLLEEYEECRGKR